MTQPQALGGQQTLDLRQAGLAEILERHQFLLAHAKQVADALDVHFLQGVACPHRQLEIHDIHLQHRILLLRKSLLIVGVGVVGAVHIPQVQPGTRVIGISVDDRPQTPAGIFVHSAVLVEDGEVDQRIDGNGVAAANALVELDGLRVHAVKVIEAGQTEAGLIVIGVFVERVVVMLDGGFETAGGFGLGATGKELGGSALVNGVDAHIC